MLLISKYIVLWTRVCVMLKLKKGQIRKKNGPNSTSRITLAARIPPLLIIMLFFKAELLKG